MRPGVRCKICGAPARETHSAVILNQYQVRYWYCDACEFWCTDEPHWLAEAYSKAIVDADTGLVSRNLTVTRRLTPLLLGVFGSTGTYVDYAGGYGLLVRLMRDVGFDFYWQDAYAQNLFARPFEFCDRQSSALTDATNVTAVTAVEVFEHLPDPLAFVNEIIESTGTDTIIFTTELHDTSLSTDWWYLTPMLGQHIAFYSRKTLRAMGLQTGMHAFSCGSLHMLTRRDDVSAAKFEILVRTSRLTFPLAKTRTRSKIQGDHAAAIAAASI
jgi:hypothetical protein